MVTVWVEEMKTIVEKWTLIFATGVGCLKYHQDTELVTLHDV